VLPAETVAAELSGVGAAAELSGVGAAAELSGVGAAAELSAVGVVRALGVSAPGALEAVAVADLLLVGAVVPGDADPVGVDFDDAAPVGVSFVGVGFVGVGFVGVGFGAAELVVGLGSFAGCSAGAVTGDAGDGSLVAEAEAGWAAAVDDGGVGPVHVLDLTEKALSVAGLPALELELDPDAGGVPVGDGPAELVGPGVVGVVVGVWLGAGVGAVEAVGVSEGTGSTSAAGGVVLAFGTLLAAGEHEGLADGLAAATFPFPFEPGAVLWPRVIRWPVPLLSAPPVPVPGVLLPGEDEAMLTIACRRPGTAIAVPANRKTAATASTGRSQAVPNRS